MVAVWKGVASTRLWYLRKDFLMITFHRERHGSGVVASTRRFGGRSWNVLGKPIIVKLVIIEVQYLTK